MGDLEKQVGNEEEERERLMEGMAVLDFDMLCSTVALQTQGKWTKLQTEQQQETHDAGGGTGDFGGVFRLWEGELLDCFDDRRIAIQSLWYFNFPFLFPSNFFFFFSF